MGEAGKLGDALPEGRREDADGAGGEDATSFELWKRSLRRPRAVGGPGEDASSLEKVLEKMVSLSELMGEIENETGKKPSAREPLLVVPGHRRPLLTIDTLDRWIEIERGG